MPRRIWLPALLSLTPCSCQEGNPSTTGADGTDSSTSGTSEGSTGGSSGGDTNTGGTPGPWPNEGMLACAAPPCTFLFAVQTLDDRIEVFAPDTDTPYRGTLQLDLKPNLDGNTGDGRLDEPYELAVAGGNLLATVGHYPTRESGSLLAIPLQLLADEAPGTTIATDAYFQAGTFSAGVVHRPLDGLEPIFVLLHGTRVLIGEFNNDLFAAEDTWTAAGELVVVDVTDPAAQPGKVALADIMGSDCAGVGEVISLGGDRIATACDGNEAVAIVDVTGVSEGAPSEGAAAITPEALCNLPAMSGVRVRHLAPAPGGGLLVAESPITASNDPARLWTLGPTCEFGAFASVAESGAGGLTQVRRIPGQTAYLVGGTVGRRGVYPVAASDDALEVCTPLAGIDAELTASDGSDLEPLAIAVSADGSRVAVGAGPFAPADATAGLGKVLWATLASDGTCATSVSDVTDLTDGASGHAPAAAVGDAATWRRGPSVLLMHEVTR